MKDFTTQAAVDETLRDLGDLFSQSPIGSLAIGAQYDEARARLEAFGQWVRSQEKQRCLRVVENEPELPGPMPDYARLVVDRLGIEASLRTAVRSTKSHIIQEIHK